MRLNAELYVCLLRGMNNAGGTVVLILPREAIATKVVSFVGHHSGHPRSKYAAYRDRWDLVAPEEVAA